MATVNVESLWESAFAALDDNPRRAMKLARRARDAAPDADGWYSYASVALEAGERAESRAGVERALALDEDHADAWALLGRLRFDGLDWAGARAAVQEAIRRDPEHPEARYVRGCLHERDGRFDEADADLDAAADEAPDDYLPARWLSDDAIEAATEAVMASLPRTVRERLAEVHILIDEVPSEEVLRGIEPMPTPDGLLACFEGAPVGDRSGSDAWAILPARILLFRRNLMRLPSDELEAELEVTLLHEIGHFLGLDEEDLAERGLD